MCIYIYIYIYTDFYLIVNGINNFSNKYNQLLVVYIVGLAKHGRSVYGVWHELMHVHS